MNKLSVTVIGAGAMGQLFSCLIRASPSYIRNINEFKIVDVTLESQRTQWVNIMNKQRGIWMLEPKAPAPYHDKALNWFANRTQSAKCINNIGVCTSSQEEVVNNRACLVPVHFRTGQLNTPDNVNLLTTGYEGSTTHIIFITTKGKPQLQKASQRAVEILYGTRKSPGVMKTQDQSAIVCMMNGAGHEEVIQSTLEEHLQGMSDLGRRVSQAAVMVGTTALSSVVYEEDSVQSTDVEQALKWTGWGETLLVTSKRDAWDKEKKAPYIGTPSFAAWSLLRHSLMVSPDSSLQSQDQSLVSDFKVVSNDEKEAVIWTKLSANVIINQLTAILDVPNGQLLQFLSEAIRSVEGDHSCVTKVKSSYISHLPEMTIGSLKAALQSTPDSDAIANHITSASIGLSIELASTILSEPIGLRVDPSTGQVSKLDEATKITASSNLKQATLGILRKAFTIASATSLNVSSMLSDVRRNRAKESLKNETDAIKPNWATENAYIGEFAACRAEEIAGIQNGMLSKIAKLVAQIPKQK